MSSPGAATATTPSKDDQTLGVRLLDTAETEIAPGQLAGASRKFDPSPSLPAAATTTTPAATASATAAQTGATSAAVISRSGAPRERLTTRAPWAAAHRIA